MSRANEAKTEQLKTLCRRVDHWRKHRSGGRSMVPEDLWTAAVEVARVKGVHATFKALRFNYYSLKDRLVMADRAASSPKKADRLATFVEVQMPSVPSITRRCSTIGNTRGWPCTSRASVRLSRRSPRNIAAIAVRRSPHATLRGLMLLPVP